MDKKTNVFQVKATAAATRICEFWLFWLLPLLCIYFLKLYFNIIKQFNPDMKCIIDIWNSLSPKIRIITRLKLPFTRRLHSVAQQTHRSTLFSRKVLNQLSILILKAKQEHNKICTDLQIKWQFLLISSYWTVFCLFLPLQSSVWFVLIT